MNEKPTDTEFAFQDLDPRQPICVYRRNLPHWRQEGVLYFTTFRLRDSIPAEVLRVWEQDRRLWLATHGVTADLPADQRNAQYRQIPEPVRRAFERDEARRFHVELDRCHGTCVLRDPTAAEVLAAALHFHHGKRLYCGDFIIMPNHVHWILAPRPEQVLETLLGSVKRHTAVRINKLTGTSGPLWQPETFDHIVRNARELDRLREYTKNNPVKASLHPGEYIHYTADWLK